MKWVLVVRRVLGQITDWLVAGRAAGLWSQNQGPNVGGKTPFDKPHK